MNTVKINSKKHVIVSVSVQTYDVLVMYSMYVWKAIRMLKGLIA